MARRIHDWVAQARAQQDNETVACSSSKSSSPAPGSPSRGFKFFWVPQVIAFVYYQLSLLLFVVRPEWSYRLNADFEDHAEHEYMTLVGRESRLGEHSLRIRVR